MMPESHKNNFNLLYEGKKKEKYPFFTEKVVVIDNKEFKYLECNVDYELLNCAMGLAKEKSQYTMSQNQANIIRDDFTKLLKCCQGVLAEMFVHILLIERYDFNVLRYDLERTSFIYKADEYDLKICIHDKYYEVETRSSNIHHKSVSKFVKDDIIIGPYGNSKKITEELSDFHFRPIYMPNFEPFVYKNGKYYYSNKMINGDIKLIITGLATKKEFINYGYKKSLGQFGTTYQVVDAIKVWDIDAMDQKFNEIIDSE